MFRFSADTKKKRSEQRRCSRGFHLDGDTEIAQAVQETLGEAFLIMLVTAHFESPTISKIPTDVGSNDVVTCRSRFSHSPRLARPRFVRKSTVRLLLV
jgi:hypothetical protein